MCRCHDLQEKRDRLARAVVFKSEKQWRGYIQGNCKAGWGVDSFKGRPR
jgi:hypothetical protein